MFTNPTIFKKMVKTALLTGALYIEQTEQHYIIRGAYWIIRVKSELLPKKEKAALIELIGELPQKGECWEARPNENIKAEAIELDLMNAYYRDSSIGYEKSNVQIARTNRMYNLYIQINRIGSDIVMIPSTIDALIDISKVRKCLGEEMPAEPRRVNQHLMVWNNDDMQLGVTLKGPMYEGEEELVNYLMKGPELKWSWEKEDCI